MAYKVIYVPIENLHRETQLTRLISNYKKGESSYELRGDVGDKAWDNYKGKRDEIKNSGQTLIDRLIAARRSCRASLIWHGELRNPLQLIRSRDAVIFVHCHGQQDVIGLSPLALTPALLASRMIDDGLSNDRKVSLVIKLWSCKSSQGAPGETFLKMFVDELSARAYHKIKVYGYRGSVNVEPPDEELKGHKGVEIDGVWLQAKDARDVLTT